jgi:hypothetical protein
MSEDDHANFGNLESISRDIGEDRSANTRTSRHSRDIESGLRDTVSSSSTSSVSSPISPTTSLIHHSNKTLYSKLVSINENCWKMVFYYKRAIILCVVLLVIFGMVPFIVVKYGSFHSMNHAIAFTIGAAAFAKSLVHSDSKETFFGPDNTFSGDSASKRYFKGAIATELGACSSIGKDLLIANGSAVDAAIGALLCIGAMNSFSSGIGGYVGHIYMNVINMNT